MAITAGNWVSATDPFIFALSHSFGTDTSDMGELIENVADTYGIINIITDDKDVQEVYWAKDGDPEQVWTVNWARYSTTGPATGDFEYGSAVITEGNTFPVYGPKDLLENGLTWQVSFDGKSNGSVSYSLFAYSAFAWAAKDPAQIIFSWIVHHTDSGLKDYLDFTNFSNASAYYDTNPCNLYLWREVGLSIAEQIKKVMQHTADVLVIGPAGTTGAVRLEIKPRRADELVDRPNLIDLEGPSLRDFTIRPTDAYTLDRIKTKMGETMGLEDRTGTSPTTYNFYSGRGVEFPNDTRAYVRQIVGDEDENRSEDWDCPYHSRKDELANHIDIGMWKDNQDEVELQFADYTHFNFEAGDIVHLTGRGYDGTEDFLVYEKEVDYDTMLATCRLLQIRGNAGKRPVQIDEPLAMHLSPQMHGQHFDGDQTFPLDAFVIDDPKNLDRWYDIANYAHATEHDRGTINGGNPPSRPSIYLDSRERWPTIGLDGVGDGLQVDYSTSRGLRLFGNLSNEDFTLFAVINPQSVGGTRILLEMKSGSDVLTFAQSGGGTPGTIQLYDGASWKGTGSSALNWQILTFVGGPLGRIRKDGVDLDTSLTVGTTSPTTSYDVGIGVDSAGSAGAYAGEIGELILFSNFFTVSQCQDVEAFLAERWGISI